MAEENKERLQKILANAGIGSRRECERLIAEGHVTIDGRIVTEMGVKVDPAEHEIAFDGEPIRIEKKVYYLLNKPKGYVTTTAEEQAGWRVIDLIRGVEQNIRAVGRLDKDSEGLLVMTNDGDLINLLTHPRHKVPKVYWVKIDGRLKEEDINTLHEGVYLYKDRAQREGVAKIGQLAVQYSSNKETILEVELHQGMNRQIRRMFARVGYRVRALKRISIAGITDPKLKTGKYRPLTSTEVDQLYRAAGKPKPEHLRKARRPRGSGKTRTAKRGDK